MVSIISLNGGLKQIAIAVLFFIQMFSINYGEDMMNNKKEIKKIKYKYASPVLTVGVVFVGFVFSIKQNEKYAEAFGEQVEKEEAKREKKTLRSKGGLW